MMTTYKLVPVQLTVPLSGYDWRYLRAWGGESRLAVSWLKVLYRHVPNVYKFDFSPPVDVRSVVAIAAGGRPLLGNYTNRRLRFNYLTLGELV